MQQFQGRITADAQFKTFESGKTAVRFSIAENQGYQPKDGSDYVDFPTFFNVTYWTKSEKILNVLRKGAVVRIDGRVSARTYQTNTGDWSASLDLLARHINVTAFAKKANETETQPEDEPKPGTGKGKGAGNKKAAQAETETADDLPF